MVPGLTRRTSPGALPFYAGVLLITSATLMLQVIQTRILSVVAWYHLAFFVISIAMFGLTAGAVWVYSRRERFTEETLSHDLAHFSVAFALTTTLAVIVQMCLSPITALTMTAFATWSILAICLALPFFFSGVTISLALTRSPFPIGRVYGVDMVGAAIGCLGVLFLLNATNGPAAVLWVSVVGAVAAKLFSVSGIGTEPREQPAFAFGPALQRRGVLTALLALFALANSITDHGLNPLYVKGRIEALSSFPMFQAWNSFSRVAVFDRGQRPPHMWGPARNFEGGQWIVPQRGMNIDGDAGTVAYGIRGDLRRAGFLKYDITNLAHYLPGHRRAAVIGVGGGRDMLAARVFGVPEVTGVEINPVFVRLLTRLDNYADYVGLRDLDGVSFHVDEARSWFARSNDSFDVIQMSLIDTWAATGAFTLSENGLYTVEAWRIFLDRLTRNGVFTVSRWYAPGEVNETGRMVSLAVAALYDMGVAEPAGHIFLASSRRIATLIVSKPPLSASSTETLRGVSNELGFDILLSPGSKPQSTVLRQIVESSSREALEAYTGSLERDLTPATDERPFFFNQLPLYDPLRTIQSALHPNSDGVNRGNILATATLALLFLLSTMLALATIIMPLRPAIRDIGRRLAFGGTMYFLLIGIGFMCVEIGLLQRLSVFLGHPIYSLSIVLFSIILATGVGSLLSDRLPLDTPTKFVTWSVLSGGYLIYLPHWLPNLTLAFDGEVLLVRALMSILIIAPGGVLMGWGFPTGMRLISSVDRAPTPWFWGINGAAGVLASSLAVAVSIAFGIGATLSIGAICYWLLIPAAWIIGFAPVSREESRLPVAFAPNSAQNAP